MEKYSDNLQFTHSDTFTTLDCYEIIFRATKTCGNGKEVRTKKSIFCPIFINYRHVAEEQRIALGTEALKSMHYYDIEYIDTKCKSMNFVRYA